MSVTVHLLAPTAENIARVVIGQKAHLDDQSRLARKARRFVKLYHDKDGYFVIGRNRQRRNAKAIRVLAIDGQLLNSGTLILEE